MDQELPRVLRGLEEAAEFARNYQFEMSDDYRALLERLEAMPQNQSGSDKTGIWRSQRAYAETFTRVRPAPRP